jgi:hypothetical protein
LYRQEILKGKEKEHASKLKIWEIEYYSVRRAIV